MALASKEWVKSLLSKMNINKYSTDEIRIGTWIDGKPIYRKTFDLIGPSSSDTNTKLVDVSELNISEIVNFLGHVEKRFPINYYIVSTDYSVVWSDSEYTGIFSRVGKIRTNTNMRLIIEYTKTTD